MTVLKPFPSKVEGWLVISELEPLLSPPGHISRSPSEAVLSKPQCRYGVVSEKDRALCLFYEESEATAYATSGESSTRIGKSSYSLSAVWNSFTTQQSSSQRKSNLKSGSSEEDFLNADSSKEKKRFFISNLLKSNKHDRRKFSNDTDGSSEKQGFSLKRSLSLGRLSRRRRASRPDLLTTDYDGDSHDTNKNTLKPTARSQSSDNLNPSRKLQHPALKQALSIKPYPIVPPPPITNSGQVYRLPPSTHVRHLHPSLVGGRQCFEITTSHSGSRRYFAETDHDIRLWMTSLRRTAKPNLENERHRENSLKLSIREAKYLPAKRRYFCDVCLDRTLYARTTSKPVTEGVFWGEEFDLNNLVDITMVTINLYREADPPKDGKKKKKRNQNQLVAYVSIPVADIKQTQDSQRWFCMQPATASTNGSVLLSSSTPAGQVLTSSTLPPGLGVGGKTSSRQDVPQMRIKARYQSVDILPLRFYLPLNNLILNNYLDLVDCLESVLGVKNKEEVASCLVNILEKEQRAHIFLVDIVEQEVTGLGNESMAFRSNTIATKAMESYLKLAGKKYLKQTLGDIIESVLKSPEDCEVDPQKLSNPNLLTKNRATLVSLVHDVWTTIHQSIHIFPVELHRVFTELRSRLEPAKDSEFCDRLINYCLFLRLICPAVLSPCLFGLAQEFPESERTARTLTLIAKSLQSLANNSLFGDKEPYMRFMNAAFLQNESPRMTQFLRQISTLEENSNTETVSPAIDFIDLGFELAVLNTQFDETFDLIPAETIAARLPELPGIMDDLHIAYNSVTTNPTRPRSQSTANPETDPWKRQQLNTQHSSLARNSQQFSGVQSVTSSARSSQLSNATIKPSVTSSARSSQLSNATIQPSVTSSARSSQLSNVIVHQSPTVRNSQQSNSVRNSLPANSRLVTSESEQVNKLNNLMALADELHESVDRSQKSTVTDTTSRTRIDSHEPRTQQPMPARPEPRPRQKQPIKAGQMEEVKPRSVSHYLTSPRAQISTSVDNSKDESNNHRSISQDQLVEQVNGSIPMSQQRNWHEHRGLDSRTTIQEKTTRPTLSKDRSVDEYEREINDLNDQLMLTMRKLAEMDGLLQQKEQENNDLQKMVTVVHDNRSEGPSQAGNSNVTESELRALISRSPMSRGTTKNPYGLRCVEDELRLEQHQMCSVIEGQERVIYEQRRHIDELNKANANLLACIENQDPPTEGSPTTSHHSTTSTGAKVSRNTYC